MIWATQNGLLGIDIGSTAVKLAQVRKSGNKVTLLNSSCASSPGLPKPSLSTQGLPDALPESYWQLLDYALQLGANGPIRAREVAFLLPKTCTTMQFMTLADGGDSHRQTVKSHLETNMAGHDRLTWDYWKWSNPADADDHENAGVLLASRQLAESAFSRFQTSGFHCRAFDGLPTALARAAQLHASGRSASPGNANNGPIAALDWGANEAMLVVALGGVPVFARTLRNLGLATAIERCGTMLGFSQREVFRIWQGDHQTQLGPLHSQLSRAIDEFVAPVVNATVEELRRTFSYLKSHRSHWSPAELILSGAGSLIPQIAATLNQRLSLHTSVWNPPTLIDSREDRSVPVALLAPAISLSTLSW